MSFFSLHINISKAIFIQQYLYKRNFDMYLSAYVYSIIYRCDGNQMANRHTPAYHLHMSTCWKVYRDSDPHNVPVRNYPSCITLWSLSTDFRRYSQNIDRTIIRKRTVWFSVRFVASMGFEDVSTLREIPHLCCNETKLSACKEEFK